MELRIIQGDSKLGYRGALYFGEDEMSRSAYVLDRMQKSENGLQGEHGAVPQDMIDRGQYYEGLDRHIYTIVENYLKGLDKQKENHGKHI